MRSALVVLALAVAAPVSEAALRAGVSRVEITSSGSMPMYGYANRKCGPANGTHDPLWAKVLVLEAGSSRLAIVTADLGSLVSTRIAREAATRLGVPAVLLAASHTHSAPAFLPYGSAPASSPAAAAYLEELESKILRAIEQASQQMFPARLGTGRGSIQLGYNRLLPRENGRARALFDNLERIPYGPVDPEVTLLRVEDASGAARALLVHYAAHAVVLGPSNCKYSADYPGVMQAKVEEQLPGTQVMFVQGGAGDINPLLLARSGNEEQDFGVVKKMGELLAAEVLKANQHVATVEAESIGVHSEVLTLDHRWEKGQTIEAGIATVLIGPHIAIATVPGEPMHKLQLLWKQQADVPHPFFYGYTHVGAGSWAGYVPDIRTAAYGGYGADVSTSVEVGAGEKILLRHLRNLYGLRGMWLDKPGRP